MIVYRFDVDLHGWWAYAAVMSIAAVFYLAQVHSCLDRLRNQSGEPLLVDDDLAVAVNRPDIDMNIRLIVTVMRHCYLLRSVVECI